MKIEKHIDEFIAAEKLIRTNSALTDNILDELANNQIKKNSTWQTLAIAASIVLAIMTGVGAGSVYNKPYKNYVSLDINDNDIENINMYKNIGNE